MSKKVNKLKESEFLEIQSLKNDAVQYATLLGELNYQKVSIDLQIETVVESIKTLKAKEEKFFSAIRESYGPVTINIETGEIS